MIQKSMGQCICHFFHGRCLNLNINEIVLSFSSVYVSLQNSQFYV